MQKHKTRQYVEGEEFLYLGNIYKLHIGNYKHIHIAHPPVFDSKISQIQGTEWARTRTAQTQRAGGLNFPNFLIFRIKEELSKWYIKQAKDIITERIEYHSTVMQTKYKSITFSDTKSKWGSCSPDNALQFNWRLIMSPLLVIDYVVIHELTHILEKNHSRLFWRKVELYKPAYRQYKKWLESNARRLFL